MVRCPECQTTFVANTLFCSECGSYLPECEPLSTEPLDLKQIQRAAQAANRLDVPMLTPSDPGTLTLHLRIGQGERTQEIELPLDQPVRLGRMDPMHDIFPEVDLTTAMGMEQGVSRRHACILPREGRVEIEDMGSTNGTLLNGERLVPYLPEMLQDGDQLQLGKLPIQVRLRYRHAIPSDEDPRRRAGHLPGS
jgi:hypothetical protein